MAGKGWMIRFLTRYRDKIVSPTPTDTSAARTLGFNGENNAGEMGLTAVQSKVPKVVGLEGKKANGRFNGSGTVMGCMNAAENIAPLMIVFPRKNENKLLTKVTLCESIGTYHLAGFKQPTFAQWIQRLVNFIRSSEESPISLMSNGRYSDTRNADVIELSEKNFPSIVSLPSHSTHKLQPSDKTFMGPQKTYYGKEVRLFLSQEQRALSLF